MNGTNTDRVRQTNAMNAGYRSHFRFVELDDAAFICRLRSDPNLNLHLSPSSPDVAAQRQWIARYKEREAAGTEFYFIIVCDGQDCGVVRMYDFQEKPTSFCWGSWILMPPRPIGLVTFSALMIYELGFDALGFAQSHFDVRRGNANVLAFHERAGAVETGSDEDNRYFIFHQEAFEDFKRKSIQQLTVHRPTPRLG